MVPLPGSVPLVHDGNARRVRVSRIQSHHESAVCALRQLASRL